MSQDDATDRLGRPAAGGDLLTLAFGTVVSMWAVGYVGWALVGVEEGGAAWAIVAGMLGCLVVGGLMTGLLTRRGFVGGLAVGGMVALLNLLILGSLVSREAGEQGPPITVWLPGTIIATCAVAGIAAAAGSAISNLKSQISNPNWTFRFALVAIAATGLLLLAGGLVTSREGGLAVPDWPRSYGYNMFFYPLTRMKGNIYYEHAHRLLGSLVGLTTIALAVHVWLADRRKWMRWVMLAAVVAVVAQGVMGGQRVELAKAGETTASLALRVAHGVAAQLFLALLAGIAAMVSAAWVGSPGATGPPVGGSARESSIGDTGGQAARGTGAESGMAVLLVILLVVQLLLGALLRHLNAALMLHVTFAAMVFLVALATGMRVLAAGHGGALRRLALALLILVGIQLALGVTALVLRTPEPTMWDVLSTTAHQLTGAALLATATALMLLAHRTTPAAHVTQPMRESTIHV